MRENLLLIDGHNFLWKSYSVPFKFHSKNGTPLHVVTTFLSLLRRSLDIVTGSGDKIYAAVVFDTDTKNPNNSLSPEYKANRKIDFSHDEDSPFHHLPNIRKALDFVNIQTYEIENIEADDVIATLATKFIQKIPERKAFIASADTDFYQLVSENINQLILRSKGEHTLIDRDWVKKKLNIFPEEYVYFKSLTGDTADNIKGIPGVGPVRASQIVNGKLQISSGQDKEMLETNRKLIELDREVRVSIRKRDLSFSSKKLDKKNVEIFTVLGL